jgi:hypothetical protein
LAYVRSDDVEGAVPFGWSAFGGRCLSHVIRPR